MIKQKNNLVWVKTNGALRSAIVNGAFGALFKTYLINEYPKSGGTWIGQMFADALELPFPRNQLPLFGNSVMHGHYLNPASKKNVVCLWRDGRDVMVSWYYHSLFKNEHHNSRLVKKVRSELVFEDYDDITQNLPRFIDYVFTKQKHPSFSWADFAFKWHGKNDVTYAKYEEFRHSTADQLQRIILETAGIHITTERATEIADKYSFSKVSGRKEGEEKKNSFMRKGIAGDWVNNFSKEAKEVFNHYAGDALILLEYEKDDQWVN